MADIIDFASARARGGKAPAPVAPQYEPVGLLPTTEVTVMYQVRTGLIVLASCDTLKDAERICRLQNSHNTLADGRPLDAFVVQITATVVIEDPYAGRPGAA